MNTMTKYIPWKMVNFVLLYSGEYGPKTIQKVEYGDDGMPVYQYFWGK